MKIFIADHLLESLHSMFTHKGMFLISLGLTPIISALTSILQIEFLGFSLGILVFLTGLILVDFYTGIKAAKYNGEILTSRKGYRSVDKLISYFMFICFTALLQGQLTSNGYNFGVSIISNFNILVFIMISLWEFHSIGENIEKRYGTKPRIFYVIDKIAKIIEKKVIEKIEGSDVPSISNNENSVESISENIDNTHVE